MREVLLPVAGRAAHALVGVGGEERAALEVVLEGQADRRAVGLEAAAAGGRLAERAGDLLTRHVEDRGCRA